MSDTPKITAERVAYLANKLADEDPGDIRLMDDELRDTIAALRRLQEQENALRNCMLLALRNSRKQNSGGWEQILRFCKQAGIEPSPLRAQP